MKERPILLNAEMVRAVLEGRKTQTRRVMRVQPDSPGYGLRFITESFNNRETGKYFWSQSDGCGINKPRSKPFSCPFGAVGDRLWVRETWTDVNLEGIPAVAYRADNDVYSPMDDKSFLDADGSFNYDDPRVSKYHFAAWYGDVISGTEGNWRPSIHMPRWASRLTLEITGVRVERLQDISRSDAIAEGGPQSHPSIYAVSQDYGFPDFSRSWFGQTWWSIYGEESWQANPWVWVIEFKRVEGQ
ncbi:hypothetical protein KYI92_08405 [Pantoea allii]|uniref:Morphogenetic protein n=1 Tax=Pantoea allii TaxID=574096 RepID=A0ABS6VD18_9GAMM|nr:hypothetical protein [Pantoea allii]MBW1213621.1 hypothetical protein [Pantoea allii]MBW1257136.1 hypothetical protein [Pantoea allii]MBW1266213.1 hypothetical protein [Pantoea allii]MBW1288408.1 hypothetical protein [Pantoea allii]